MAELSVWKGRIMEIAKNIDDDVYDEATELIEDLEGLISEIQAEGAERGDVWEESGEESSEDW